jgi:outer membrane protein, heavy metal efflux system
LGSEKETIVMSHIIILAAIITFMAVPVGAAQGITVDDAVLTALGNNTELQTLRYEGDLARAQLEKAKLLLPANPVLAGTLSNKDKPADTGGGKYTNYSLTLSQEFEIGGQRGLRIDIAKKNISRVTYLIRDRERVLIYEVKNGFARAFYLRKREELTKRVVKLQEELLDFTKIKYKAGSVSGLEVNLAEVELGKAKRDDLSVTRESREALNALQGLMGVKPTEGFMVQGDLSPDVHRLPDRQSLKERAEALRPDLKALGEEVELSSRAVDLAKREAIPNVTFGGFQSRDETLNERGVLMSVSIPLFDRKQAERKGAQARAWQAKVRRSGLEKGLDREIEDAYNNLALSLQELSVFKQEIINKSMEALNLLNFAFKEGKISFFEVRTAQKDTLEMQFAYLDALLQTQRAVHGIERAAGGDVQW